MSTEGGSPKRPPKKPLKSKVALPWDGIVEWRIHGKERPMPYVGLTYDDQKVFLDCGVGAIRYNSKYYDFFGSYIPETEVAGLLNAVDKETLFRKTVSDETDWQFAVKNFFARTQRARILRTDPPERPTTREAADALKGQISDFRRQMYVERRSKAEMTAEAISAEAVKMYRAHLSNLPNDHEDAENWTRTESEVTSSSTPASSFHQIENPRYERSISVWREDHFKGRDDDYDNKYQHGKPDAETDLRMECDEDVDTVPMAGNDVPMAGERVDLEKEILVATIMLRDAEIKKLRTQLDKTNVILTLIQRQISEVMGLD